MLERITLFLMSYTAGGTFASTGDFSTATKLFKKGPLGAPPQSDMSAESSHAHPPAGIHTSHTLTLTPAESMSLDDLGNVETFDRQVRRERGSFSPTSAPRRQRERTEQISAALPSSATSPVGRHQSKNAGDTGVFQSSEALFGTGPWSDGHGGERARSSLYSTNADTGEFQSATSLFSQNAQFLASRGSSEETRVRGTGSGDGMSYGSWGRKSRG